MLGSKEQHDAPTDRVEGERQKNLAETEVNSGVDEGEKEPPSGEATAVDENGSKEAEIAKEGLANSTTSAPEEKPMSEGEPGGEVEDLRVSLAAQLLANHRLFFYESDENPLKASMEQFQLPIITEVEEEEEEEEEEGKREGKEVREKEDEGKKDEEEEKDEASGREEKAEEIKGKEEEVTKTEEKTDEQSPLTISLEEGSVVSMATARSVLTEASTTEGVEDDNSDGPRVISPSSTEHSLLLFVTESFKEGLDGDEPLKGPETSAKKTAEEDEKGVTGKVAASKKVSFAGGIGVAKSESGSVGGKKSTTASRKTPAAPPSTASSNASSTTRVRRLMPAKSEPLKTAFKTPQRPTISKSQLQPKEPQTPPQLPPQRPRRRNDGGKERLGSGVGGVGGSGAEGDGEATAQKKETNVSRPDGLVM